MAVVFLAIDAVGFDGYYRHAVWSEARYQALMARYTVERYLSGWQQLDDIPDAGNRAV